jgi:hypothetical protein
MRADVYAFAIGMFQIIAVVMVFGMPFVLMRVVLQIFRWVIGRARGERMAELQEDTLDTYDRARATALSGGQRADRDSIYAEMRGVRGRSGRQTRW